MVDVLLATCADHPSGDEDGPAIIAALSSLGVEGRWAVWDDQDTDRSCAPVVLRATWDYTRRLKEFLHWARSVPRLINPIEVVEWNVDKIYLEDLAAAGVPIVPSVFAAVGEPVALPESGEFVVKPSLGAGSRGAGRFGAGEHAAALAHARSLHDEGRTVLVQPYLPDVDTAGETALVYLDGEFSHAARKGPLLSPGTTHGVRSARLFVPENITAREPTPAELTVGAQALAVLRDRFDAHLLYARIDLLPTPDGPVVIEVEVTEPSLFLGFSAGAADRLADAIQRRL